MRNDLWLFVFLHWLVLAGCHRVQTIENSYPGTIRLLSMYEDVAKIEDCEGLADAQPSGYLRKCDPGNEYPKTYNYHRLDALPKEFTIRWKTSPSLAPSNPDPPDEKHHVQKIVFPEGLRGAKGDLLFLLDENNVWSCSLRDEQDWRIVLKE
jgi:hypothetical protein